MIEGVRGDFEHSPRNFQTGVLQLVGAKLFSKVALQKFDTCVSTYRTSWTIYILFMVKFIIDSEYSFELKLS